MRRYFFAGLVLGSVGLRLPLLPEARASAEVGLLMLAARSGISPVDELAREHMGARVYFEIIDRSGNDR